MSTTESSSRTRSMDWASTRTAMKSAMWDTGRTVKKPVSLSCARVIMSNRKTLWGSKQNRNKMWDLVNRGHSNMCDTYCNISKAMIAWYLNCNTHDLGSHRRIHLRQVLHRPINYHNSSPPWRKHHHWTQKPKSQTPIVVHLYWSSLATHKQ